MRLFGGHHRENSLKSPPGLTEI
ncbi:hypothetical protein EMIT0158MI4_100207 [Burkholderia ambifaria]